MKQDTAGMGNRISGGYGFFLINDELLTLTGYIRNADRCRWLKDHGWTFEKSFNGRPVVSRSHAESMLGVKTEKRREPQLNLDAIRKM